MPVAALSFLQPPTSIGSSLVPTKFQHRVPEAIGRRVLVEIAHTILAHPKAKEKTNQEQNPSQRDEVISLACSCSSFLRNCFYFQCRCSSLSHSNFSSQSCSSSSVVVLAYPIVGPISTTATPPSATVAPLSAACYPPSATVAPPSAVVIHPSSALGPSLVVAPPSAVVAPPSSAVG